MQTHTYDALQRAIRYLDAVEITTFNDQARKAVAHCSSCGHNIRKCGACICHDPLHGWNPAAPRRYAFRAEQRGYNVVDAQALSDLAIYLRPAADGRDGLIPGEWGKWHAAHAPTLMPPWWTPEQQFAIRNRIGGIYTVAATMATATTFGTIDGDRVVTADLYTGEEMPA